MTARTGLLLVGLGVWVLAIAWFAHVMELLPGTPTGNLLSSAVLVGGALVAWSGQRRRVRVAAALVLAAGVAGSSYAVDVPVFACVLMLQLAWSAWRPTRARAGSASPTPAGGRALPSPARTG